MEAIVFIILQIFFATRAVFENWGIYKQWPPFGAKICSDICPRTLSVPRSEQFGQISELIFAPNGGYCLYYPSNLLCNARSFETWGIFSDIPQF